MVSVPAPARQMMWWTSAAGEGPASPVGFPVTCSSPEPASFRAGEYEKIDTMPTSPLPGPVGFQYGNIPMAKGMFTSIGMSRGLFHPLPTPRLAQNYSRGSASLQGACHAQIYWAPPLSVPNGLSHPNPRSLRLIPSFCPWGSVPGCTSKLWSLHSKAGVRGQ